MKLVTFEVSPGVRHIGAMTADLQSIIDFTAADPAPEMADMLALIDGGGAALDKARALHAAARNVVGLDAVRLLSPVPVPRQMRDCLVFEKHLRQAGERSYRNLLEGDPKMEEKLAAARAEGRFDPPKAWYAAPVYYKQNRFTVIGHGQDVEWPHYTRKLDYELEFGIFIGKTGKDIPKERAREHIFGFVVFNDFSARDIQAAEMSGRLGPAKGKDFDTGNAIGPWLVTADEIPDPYALTMVARVNGEEWSRGSTSTMHHKFEDIIAHVSMSETLYAGEFLGSGTVGGGCGLELGRYLEPGDVVELEVDGIGVLRNRVVKKS